MTTGTQRRQAIVDQVASCVCKDRQNTYGDAEDNFANIAEYWTVWLRSRKLIAADASVQAHDVAVMSGLIKVARLSTSPDHIDNWVDLAGYSVCGGGIRVKAKESKDFSFQPALNPIVAAYRDLGIPLGVPAKSPENAGETVATPSEAVPEIKVGSKWVGKSDGWDATIQIADPDTIHYTLGKVPGYYHMSVARFLELYEPCTA